MPELIRALRSCLEAALVERDIQGHDDIDGFTDRGDPAVDDVGYDCGEFVKNMDGCRRFSDYDGSIAVA